MLLIQDMQLQKEYKEIAKFAISERAQDSAEDDGSNSVFEEPLQASTLLEFAAALTQRVMGDDGDLSYATRSALENFVRGHRIPAHPSEPNWKHFEALQAAEAATADKRAFLRSARDLVLEALASLPDGPAAGYSGKGGAGGSKGGGAGKGVSLPAIKTLVEADWEAQGGTGFDAAKVTAAVKALVLKGSIVQVGGRYHLAKGKDKPKPSAAAAASTRHKASGAAAASSEAAAAAAGAAKLKAAAARKPAAKPVPKAATKAVAAKPKAAAPYASAVARKNPLPGPSSPAAAAKPAVSKSPAHKAAGAAATSKPAARGKAAAPAAASPRLGRAGATRSDAAGATAAAKLSGRGPKAAAGGVRKVATKKVAAAAAVDGTAGAAAEPPQVVDGKPMWKIEKFVSLRKGRGRGKRTLRVRWQGWGADDDSWLPEKQLVEDLGAQGFAELLEELEQAGGVRGKSAKAAKGGRGSKAGAGKASGGVQKRAAGSGAAKKRGAAGAGGRGKNDHVRASFPAPLALTHLGQLDSNAAQAAAFMPVYDNPHPPYALVLVANYYGSSSLHLLRPGHRPLLKPLAVLQTECGHSWAAWEQGGRRWAAIANYCSKDGAGDSSGSNSSSTGSGSGSGGHKGVVIYELEQLAAASSSAGPDWGFKAAVALTAKGASHVLHFELPGGVGAGTGAGRGTGGRRRKAAATAGRQRSWLGGGRKVEEGEVEEEREEEGAEEDLEGEHGGEERLPAHVLAVAAYGSDEIVLYGLMWDAAKRQFALLQVLATDGAHGGRCFPVYEPGADPTTASSSHLLSSSSSSRSSDDSSSKAGSGGQQQQQQQQQRHAGAQHEALYLAIANSRSGEEYEANSTIWRYDPTAGRFLLHQMVETVGAHDVQHLRLPPHVLGKRGGRFATSSARHARRPGGGGSDMGSQDEVTGPGLDVLVFANRGVDQACSLEEHSPILVWHPGRRRFEPTAHLSGISCATGLAAGRLRQHGAAGPPTTYLLATGDRTANGSYTGAMTHVWSLEEEKAPGAFGGGGGGGGGGGVGGHFTSTLQH
eukprot:XP_001698026.1 hypothetical protein CHLREDRAFT_176862 [Chlamydomonas reinhardtii]